MLYNRQYSDIPTPSISFQSATFLSGIFQRRSFPSKEPLRKYLSSYIIAKNNTIESKLKLIKIIKKQKRVQL